MKITYEHVQAHQDDITEYSQLGRMAQMNVRMDWLAKSASQLVHNKILSPPKISAHPLGFATISVNDYHIPHQASTLIYERISGHILDKWWITKGRYKLEDIPTIHWDVCQQGASSHAKSSQRFSAKWSSGCLATGSNMKKWNFRAGDACPFCLHPKEDTTHILHCPHAQALSLWTENFSVFLNQLLKLDTDPALVALLDNEMTAWRFNTRGLNPHMIPSTLRGPLNDLRHITYDRFLEGLIPNSLIRHQEQFYRSQPDCRKIGETWGKKVY